MSPTHTSIPGRPQTPAASAPPPPVESAAARSEPAGQPVDSPAAPITPGRRQKRTLFERMEAFVSRLSTRNNFWHRVCSLIWLPYAFHSGIRMKRLDAKTFQAILPFRRFNRNWYNAMAGAALLGNSEIAGGTYVFGICGGDFTVVCKHLEYKFLRPCLGPAIYRITPRDDIHALAASGVEFNTTIDMEIVQAITKPGSKERRVGQCAATFHVTPKKQQRSKGRLK